MLSHLIFPFLLFIIGVNITPGPNNIASTSAGSMFGYRKTMPFLQGIFVGFFLVMLLSGLFASYISGISKLTFEALKWLGAAYLIYLALIPFFTYTSKDTNKRIRHFTFYHGIALQFINPKVVLYGLTVHASFSIILDTSIYRTIITSILLAFLSFICNTIWTMLGHLLSKYFKNKLFYYVFNGVLALMLGWVVWEMLKG